MSQESLEKSKHKIIAIISALIPQAKIYLYGSRARGTAHEWSDIDIAIDAGNELPQLEIGEVRDLIAELNIPYTVDIVDINSHLLPEPLKVAIRRDRVLWKS